MNIERTKARWFIAQFMYEHYKVKANTDILTRCKIGEGGLKFGILKELCLI